MKIKPIKINKNLQSKPKKDLDLQKWTETYEEELYVQITSVIQTYISEK